MESAVAKAIKMMAIALPTMFFVIAIFYVATKALHKAFRRRSKKKRKKRTRSNPCPPAPLRLITKT